jgi:hypothetical protein
MMATRCQGETRLDWRVRRKALTEAHGLQAGAARRACFLACALLLVTPPAVAQIYRCVVEGRVVYADRPCAANSVPIAVDPQGGTVPQQPKDAPNPQHEANMGRLVVGMTLRQVEQAWGKPASVGSEQDAQGTSEVWTFTRGAETTLVHFRDGHVAKIAKQRSLVAPAPPARPVREPTIADLEERERIDKARERRHIREGMTQSEIRATLGPPSDRRQRPTNWGWGDCWTYPPAPLDAQTRTVLCFDNLDLRLVTIDRAIER